MLDDTRSYEFLASTQNVGLKPTENDLAPMIPQCAEDLAGPNRQAVLSLAYTTGCSELDRVANLFPRIVPVGLRHLQLDSRYVQSRIFCGLENRVSVFSWESFLTVIVGRRKH